MSDEPKTQLLFYQAPDGRTRLEVRMKGETVWLTQAQMAELFQTTQQNVSLHIQHIYKEGGVDAGGNSQGILVSSTEGPVADVAGFLCHGSEQYALGGTRAHGGGDCSQSGQRFQAEHGVDKLAGD
jgi:hypothetical protein